MNVTRKYFIMEKSKTMKKKCVYHYCNLNTFYSIISNKSLRLSDITKSNDQLEITWAVDIIREVFIEQYSELAGNVKGVISKEKYINRINKKIALYFEQNELEDNLRDCITFSQRKNSGYIDIGGKWCRKIS